MAAQQGWCTVREPGVFKDTEPTPTSGWGFCSKDNCNGYVATVTDPSAVKVDILNERYCVDKLGDNLRVEQPSVKREEYENLLGGAKAICIGHNTTRDFNRDVFYEIDDSGAFKKVSSQHNPVLQVSYV
jgi:hypothetical protein